MDSASREFIEQMGIIAQRSGSPRISGRVSGLLILRGEPVALQDIAETLQVSKASASTNARLLRDRGMLRLTTKPGERQDYYELVPNPFQSMLSLLSKEMQQAAEEIDEVMASFVANQRELRQRVQGVQHFYAGSAVFLADISQKLSNNTDVTSKGRKQE